MKTLEISSVSCACVTLAPLKTYLGIFYYCLPASSLAHAAVLLFAAFARPVGQLVNSYKSSRNLISFECNGCTIGPILDDGLKEKLLKPLKECPK